MVAKKIFLNIIRSNSARLRLLLMSLTLPCALAVAQQWALANVSVANLRSQPRHSAELETQVLMGTPLKVLESSGDWLQVEAPDSYRAWVDRGAVAQKSERQMQAWRKAKRAVVVAQHETECYSLNPTEVPNPVSDLVEGCIVEVVNWNNADSIATIKLPDGRKAAVHTIHIEDFEQWSMQPFNPQAIVQRAYSLVGRPYLWGGTSCKAVDCSGLVKVCFFSNGVILPRNASQQASLGSTLTTPNLSNLREADLVFFGNGTSKRITHVGIHSSGGELIHASGRVRVNSLHPNNANYVNRNTIKAVHIEERHIQRVAHHKWYFQ